MKSLVKYFLRGLLILVPAGLTLYIVYALLSAVDRLFAVPESWGLPLPYVPGLGLLVTLVVIVVVGYLGSNLFTRRVVRWLDTVFKRLPLIKLLYSSLRDLMGALVGRRRSFDQPVVVQFASGSDARMVGFVTREDLEFLGMDNFVAVYFPQSYNFAGNLMLFPRRFVTPIPASATDVMAFIVSGGISGARAGESLLASRIQDL